MNHLIGDIVSLLPVYTAELANLLMRFLENRLKGRCPAATIVTDLRCLVTVGAQEEEKIDRFVNYFYDHGTDRR